MFRRTLLAGILALASASATAATFSYNFAEAGIGEVDEGDAIFLKGSMSLNSNLFALGSLYGVDAGVDIPGYDAEGFYAEAGLGYAMPIAPELDVFGTAQVLYADIDVPGEDTDVGYITHLGVRYMPMSQIELEGALAYSANDLLLDDGMGYIADARYHISPAFSAAIGFSQDTELDGAFLNVRYNFQ